MAVRFTDVGRTPLGPVSRLAQFAFALLLLTALLVISGLAIPRPWEYPVLGLAFLATVATLAMGLWARVRIAKSETMRGDLLAFVAVVIPLLILDGYFLVLAPLLMPAWVTFLLGMLALLLVVFYAFASAAPGVRVVMLVGIFFAVPLMLLAASILETRQEARQRESESRVRQMFNAFRGYRDLQRK